MIKYLPGVLFRESMGEFPPEYGVISMLSPGRLERGMPVTARGAGWVGPVSADLVRVHSVICGIWRAPLRIAAVTRPPLLPVLNTIFGSMTDDRTNGRNYTGPVGNGSLAWCLLDHVAGPSSIIIIQPKVIPALWVLNSYSSMVEHTETPSDGYCRLQ